MNMNLSDSILNDGSGSVRANIRKTRGRRKATSGQGLPWRLGGFTLDDLEAAAIAGLLGLSLLGMGALFTVSMWTWIVGGQR